MHTSYIRDPFSLSEITFQIKKTHNFMYYTVIFQHIDLFHFVQKQTVSAFTYFTQKHITQNVSLLAPSRYYYTNTSRNN